METISLTEQKKTEDEATRSNSVDKNSDAESSSVRFLTTKDSKVRQQQSSTWKKRKLPLVILMLLAVLSVALIATILALRKARGFSLLVDMNCGKERKITPDALASLSITETFHECSNDISGMSRKMKLFSTDSEDGRKLAKQMFLNVSNIPSHIIVSPLLQVPSNSCWISLLQSNSSNDKFYIITQLGNDINTTRMTSSQSFLKSYVNDVTQLYIAALTAHDSLGAVKITFTPCVEYIRVQKTEIKKTDSKIFSPDFTQVRNHQFHRCNYIQFDDRESCDWWEITARNNNGVVKGKFEWHLDMELEDEDIGYRPRKNFLKMSGKKENGFGNISYGFFVSPIFAPTEVSRNFTFWFHYKNPCKYNQLSAYVVPANEDFLAAASLFEPFVSITNKTCWWNVASKKITIPNDYSQFQILFKTSVLNHAPPAPQDQYNLCSTKDCKETAVYMDEITLEINYPKCSSPNTNINQFISINFTSPNITPWSYQSWQITRPDKVKNHLAYDAINFKFEAYSDNYTLWLDFTDVDNGERAYVRSPLLIANSNCSCQFTFKYMFIDKSDEAMNFHVLQRFGESSSQRENDAKSIWFMRVAGSEQKWKSAQVSLTLVNNGVPFLLEFNEERGVHSGLFMFYDDIAFHGCDFSLHQDI